MSLTTRDFSSIVTISARRWKARRRAVVRRRLRQFGSGDIASLFTGIGPHRDLIGQTPAAVGVAAGAAACAPRSPRRTCSPHVDRSVVPAQIAGDLRGGRGGAKRDLAVAVNGRIEAVGRSFYLTGDPTEHFALMVPRALAARRKQRDRPVRGGRRAPAPAGCGLERPAGPKPQGYSPAAAA